MWTVTDRLRGRFCSRGACEKAPGLRPRLVGLHTPSLRLFYFFCFSTAWAAASLAIGTRNGEQET